MSEMPIFQHFLSVESQAKTKAAFQAKTVPIELGSRPTKTQTILLLNAASSPMMRPSPAAAATSSQTAPSLMDLVSPASVVFTNTFLICFEVNVMRSDSLTNV